MSQRIKHRSILFASTNAGKLREVSVASSKYGIKIVSPAEFKKEYLELPGKRSELLNPPQVVENGATYLENAQLKADAFFAWSGVPSLGDDTGLEVDALGGAPGLHSARYAGPDCIPAQNIEKLLKALEEARERTARFRCVLYFREDEKSFITVDALLEGEIAHEPRGKEGFGYDSVFIVEGSGKTLAELKEQDELSETHRIRALNQLFKRLV